MGIAISSLFQLQRNVDAFGFIKEALSITKKQIPPFHIFKLGKAGPGTTMAGVWQSLFQCHSAGIFWRNKIQLQYKKDSSGMT